MATNQIREFSFFPDGRCDCINKDCYKVNSSAKAYSINSMRIMQVSYFIYSAPVMEITVILYG